MGYHNARDHTANSQNRMGGGLTYEGIHREKEYG